MESQAPGSTRSNFVDATEIARILLTFARMVVRTGTKFSQGTRTVKYRVLELEVPGTRTVSTGRNSTNFPKFPIY